MTSDNGDCETSYFTSNPVTGPAIPPICGGNDGLHLYMDAGAYYDDQSTFSVVVGESGLDWKILVGIAFFTFHGKNLSHFVDWLELNRSNAFS